MGNKLIYGKMSPTKPSLGSVSGYLNFGAGTLNLGINQDGKMISSLSWGNRFVHVDSENGLGWSIPLGVASFGEDYKSNGKYMTLSLGHPVAGLTFSVNENNPTTGMAAASMKMELFDQNNNLIGYETWTPVPVNGWSYEITRVDLQGKPLAEPKLVPMPVENQMFYASGVPPTASPPRPPSR